MNETNQSVWLANLDVTALEMVLCPQQTLAWFSEVLRYALKRTAKGKIT